MIHLVLAPNPGPMTLDGTNTYVVGAGLVVDPGPVCEQHAARIGEHARPTVIALTHRHLDHSESAAGLAARWGVPVRAADPALCVGADPLTDSTVLDLPGGTVTVIATPGHTDDSISLLVESPDAAAVLLTGDTVLGRGTTVITQPDGDLGAYLDSLSRLEQAIMAHDVEAILPGHGPRVSEPAAAIAAYRAHRHLRLDQIRAALDRGAESVDDVVDLVYLGLDPAVRPAAVQSVRAQLAYLRGTGPD